MLSRDTGNTTNTYKGDFVSFNYTRKKKVKRSRRKKKEEEEEVGGRNKEKIKAFGKSYVASTEGKEDGEINVIVLCGK